MDTHNIQCRICSEKFFSLNLLIIHLNKHFSNFVCEKCGKGFAMWRSYTKHMHIHNVGCFKCQHCEMTFETSIKLSNHQVRHRRSHKCRICENRFPTLHFLKKHRMDDHNLGSACAVCGKVFVNPSQLQRHIYQNHKQRTRMYACEFCHIRFYEKTSLNVHTVKHSGKRNYTCNVCNKSFTWKNNLATHLKMHDNIRNHICKHCGEAFVQYTSLKWHLRKHENKKVHLTTENMTKIKVSS